MELNTLAFGDLGGMPTGERSNPLKSLSDNRPMPSPPRAYDVLVLGAGAAGLMCAAAAAGRGRRVALLDHNTQPGRKILISGGGRCNFTNIHCAPDRRFLSANPHFAKSALALYTPQHFLELVNRYRIPWHEKTLGQLFCDHSSRAILDMLLSECERGRVDLILNARNIQVNRSSVGFHVTSLAGEFKAEALVIASGGLSIPKLRRHRARLRSWLASSMLRIVKPRPALVPLVLGGDEARWTELTGVSTEVIAWTGSSPGASDSLTVRRPRSALSRKNALHAPGPQRPRHPPGIVLLASRRTPARRLRARSLFQRQGAPAAPRPPRPP